MRSMCAVPLLLTALLVCNRISSTMAEKTALVLLANGAEEIETIIPIDVLRRAGVRCIIGLVSGSNGMAKCSRGVNIAGDVSLAEAITMGPYDAVVLPGGLEGAKTLAADETVKKLLVEQDKDGRIVAAICAAPALVLPAAGVGEGKRVTCYPSLETNFGGKYTYVAEEKVVVDGNIVTSQGPGTAFDFALRLAEILVGADQAAAVRKALLL